MHFVRTPPPPQNIQLLEVVNLWNQNKYNYSNSLIESTSIFHHGDVGFICDCEGALSRGKQKKSNGDDPSTRTVTDTEYQATNKKLEQLYSQDLWPGAFYLVTNDYSSAPQKCEDNCLSEGTIPPLRTFTSPFRGKTVEDGAKWLENAPSTISIDRHYFAVLDDNSEANDSVTICRKHNHDYDGGPKAGEVQFFPWPAAEAGNVMTVAKDLAFDDRLDMYQGHQRSTGGADLSRGTPFWKFQRD